MQKVLVAVVLGVLACAAFGHDEDCPKPTLSIRGPCPDPCPPAPDCVCPQMQPYPCPPGSPQPCAVTVQPTPVVVQPTPMPPPRRSMEGLVLPLTAAYLADDWAAGGGLGYQFDSGVMFLGQALYWNGIAGDGSSSRFVSVTRGGGSDDTHCGHGHFPPCDPGGTRFATSSGGSDDSGEWGFAATIVIPLGR